MTVGLLLDSLKLKDPKAENGRVMDDWIYVCLLYTSRCV